MSSKIEPPSAPLPILLIVTWIHRPTHSAQPASSVLQSCHELHSTSSCSIRRTIVSPLEFASAWIARLSLPIEEEEAVTDAPMTVDLYEGKVRTSRATRSKTTHISKTSDVADGGDEVDKCHHSRGSWGRARTGNPRGEHARNIVAVTRGRERRSGKGHGHARWCCIYYGQPAPPSSSMATTVVIMWRRNKTPTSALVTNPRSGFGFVWLEAEVKIS